MASRVSAIFDIGHIRLQRPSDFDLLAAITVDDRSSRQNRWLASEHFLSQCSIIQGPAARQRNRTSTGRNWGIPPA